MEIKDVSFWCIVLAIIIAMTFHHILSDELIEGNSDMEVLLEFEKSPDIEAKERENEILREENDNLRGELNKLEDNLKNSQSIIEKTILEASAEVEVDPPLEEGDFIEEEEEEEEEEELIFPVDNNKYEYEITTCGKVGKTPPNKEDCRRIHSRSWFEDPSIYGYDEENGIHHWIVPKTGSYIIEVAGASGGTIKGAEENDIGLNPGKGAIIKGIFYLKKDDKYNIIIGQKGTTPTSPEADPWNGGAAGGGGTFMWKDKDISEEPLIVAGGGGGQGIFGHNISGHGGNGSLSEDGSMGSLVTKLPDTPHPGNVVDNFGKNGGRGGDPSNLSRKSKGWKYINRGGNMDGMTNYFKTESGFGGGGIMFSHAGGGGGGYSGGGSKKYGYAESNTMGGGGGGSFFDEDGFKREDSLTLDYNDGDGYLKIQFIKDYFLVEGNKNRCQDYGGYEPSSSKECEEASNTLGFEWESGPNENGWNNNKCELQYSKCIWKKESDSTNSICNENKKSEGLIYNEECSGMEGYETNGLDNVYKTVCISPIKALS